MRPLLFLPAVLLPLTLSLPASAAGCEHLVVDPAGDADHFGNTAPYPTQIDDPAQVDVRWAELRTTRTHLVATVKLQDLNPEGVSNLDHAYSMTYRNGGRGIQLIAMFEGPTSTSPTWARAWTSELDESQPDDGGVWVGQYLGDIKAVRELRADRVVLTAELSMLGGLQGTVTGIGAQGWGANAAASTYGVADRATTTRTYRPGTRDCLR